MSDLISRQEALDALKRLQEMESDNFTNTNPLNMMTVAVIANCMEEITNLPPAKQDQKFSVIDLKTGKEPDTEDIALHEDWAKGLVYCDMEGFTIGENGDLYLLDECERWKPCPEGRFKVVYEECTEKSGRWLWKNGVCYCSECGNEDDLSIDGVYMMHNFCPNCGSKME